jgi:hypothetical protein
MAVEVGTVPSNALLAVRVLAVDAAVKAQGPPRVIEARAQLAAAAPRRARIRSVLRRG